MPILFSIVAPPIYISTNSVGGIFFSIPSPAFNVYRFCDDGHTDSGEEISNFSFDLHFSDQIANIHWIIEKAREFQKKKKIYFCFIDYDKGFDCVDHNKLWKILKEI